MNQRTSLHRFWRLYPKYAAILISLLLTPMIIVIFLAAAVDPLYFWFAILAIVPAFGAAIVVILSGILAVIFLIREQSATQRQRSWALLSICLALVCLAATVKLSISL